MLKKKLCRFNYKNRTLSKRQMVIVFLTLPRVATRISLTSPFNSMASWFPLANE